MSAEPVAAGRHPGRLLVLPFYEGLRVVVVLAGRVDASNAVRLHDWILACVTHRPRTLIVDTSDLTVCDRPALDALTDAVSVAEQSGITVSLRPVEPGPLVAKAECTPWTSGRPGLDPSGRPLPRAPQRTS